jgi:hypothetical protein
MRLSLKKAALAENGRGSVQEIRAGVRRFKNFEVGIHFGGSN